MAFYEARPFLFLFGLLTLGAWLVWPWLAILPAGLLLFTFYFFRDPERKIDNDARSIVSAADGRVIVVDEPEEIWFNRKKMKRIAIFLSVMDVHVNRSPIAGEILDVQYEEGAFLDARDPKIVHTNENMRWRIRGNQGEVVVRQIAGLIARRIVGWQEVGHVLEKGERFGMIRFGSRTDIYMPLNCEVVVKNGDHVKAGETVLAYWPDKSGS